MSTASPAATSPIRSTWDSHYPWYSGNEYENAPSPYRGPPPPHVGAPPPGYFRGHHDFWPPEPQSGSAYWGHPPPFEGSGYQDRQICPPRHPRALPPPHQQRPIRGYEESQQTSLSRVPSSPRPSFPRGSLQGKRDLRYPPTPRRGLQQGGGSASSSTKDKKKGDALSILANVSAGMGGKDGKRAPQQPPSHPLPIPAPTSPLQRRARPSPITPSQTPQDRQRQQRHQVTPIASNTRSQEPPPSGSWEQPPEAGYQENPSMPYHHPSRRRYLPHYGEYGHPGYHDGNPPVLVERGGSFDSQGDSPYRDFTYPPTPPSGHGPYYYDEHPPSFGYWDSGPNNQQGPYLPPRWNYGPPVEPYHPDYPYEPHDEAFPQHRLPPPPPQAAPYTYVQQPRLEEKTILRKKFSWKHYPELERFLIANRDEYLKHSNMNYTAEQKQYNNWLTERLLEVAEQNHYVFDPDDFNFVAIRDRIRCYYKSYVQTARKRGLKLPADKKKD